MQKYNDYKLLRLNFEDGVAFVTIDAPPINLMTIGLFEELARLGTEVAEDEEVMCVVLRSANPNFFIAHFDLKLMDKVPLDKPAKKPVELTAFHQMCETYRTMPKPTIVEIANRIGGGGNELAMSCDMRFGAIGSTVINQMEVPLGILPCGTGTQRLPRLVGRGRAMEVALGAMDIDAKTAESWGLLNRALPPDELCSFVTGLAKRIATFPPYAVAAAKQSIDNAYNMNLQDALLEENFLSQQNLRKTETKRRFERFLQVGGQTENGETNLSETIDKLAYFEDS